MKSLQNYFIGQPPGLKVLSPLNPLLLARGKCFIIDSAVLVVVVVVRMSCFQDNSTHSLGRFVVVIASNSCLACTGKF